MDLIQLLSILIMAVLAVAAPVTEPLHPMHPDYATHLRQILARNPTTTLISKRQSYQWVCNQASLPFSSIRVCQNYLQLTVRQDTCTADPNHVDTGRLCESGNVRVTALSWKGGKVSVECVKAGDAVAFLLTNCGSQGGSAVANGNGNFIVHVNDHWIV